MSFLGKRWAIDGVIAGQILRSSVNGHYLITFEREYATLEEIEGINWTQPTVAYIHPFGNAPEVLPAGYGFELVNIEYQHGTQYYQVEIKVAQQYLGDVTGYQEQIAELEGAAAEKDSTIAEQATQIQEQEDVLTAQQAVIADQAATIQELQAAGTATALEAELDAAYVEGVNSVE